MTAAERTPWPTADQYTIAHRCPTCRAEPGDPCIIRRGQRTFHCARQDAGMRHYRRDVGRAPWPEDRTPGERYDTL